jgi:FkbM family methyltransferase
MVSSFSLVRTARGLLRRLRGRPRQGVELDANWVFLGTEYGGYAVLPERLGPESIVFSVGLGEDISFDLALIERFGCRVHGFDPTPRSIEWLESQALPERFELHRYGLADFDGVARFVPPENPAHVSHRLVNGTRENVSEFPVKRLSTVLAALGYSRIDVLKLDIEGAEYGVLEEMLAIGALPEQLLVEFHHGMHGIPLARTEAMLDRLVSAGYRVFEARDTGREFSLAR